MTRSDLDQIEEGWRRLRACGGPQLSDAFRDYCERVIAVYEAGELTTEMAGRYIARAMFIPGLDADPVREAITMYAGELEVPGAVGTTNKWRAIRELLSEL